MSKSFDVVVQLGSQVMHADGQYQLAAHTEMRTAASAIVLHKGIAPYLIVSGGSNFGVRYDDSQIFGANHPTQKKPVFTFEAFATSDYDRKAESVVIKEALVKLGADPSKILAEPLSATTEENAEFVKLLLRRRPMFRGDEKIGILTLLYHMERALPVFQKAGLDVQPLFAENVLAENDHGQVETICTYYGSPKGGKQYPVNEIRRLLESGTSLQQLITQSA